MGVLQRFERRLGGLVEGAFAKVFKGEVEPVEVASALQREIDDRRAIVAQGRVLVPNDFVVELGDHDYDRLSPYEAALCQEFAAMVREHADEVGYAFLGPLTVGLEHVADLDTGIFRIRSGVAPGGAAPVSSHTALYRTGPQAAARDGREPTAQPAAPPTRIRHWLLLGGGRGVPELSVPVTAPVMIVGRGTDADLHLDDPGVSRRHAELRLVADALRVTDLGSTNGTAVNSARVTSALLSDGDQVRVGSTVLVYRRDTG